jgi:hypothetical protein
MQSAAPRRSTRCAGRHSLSKQSKYRHSAFSSMSENFAIPRNEVRFCKSSMKPCVKTLTGNIVLSGEICNHGGGFESSHLVYSLLDPLLDLGICVGYVAYDGGLLESHEF